MLKRVVVEVGAGDLLDRVTIVELKLRHAGAGRQRARFARQLGGLMEAVERADLDLGGVEAELAELRAINSALWQIEDELRSCEVRGDFGPRFVELARSVYISNDRRAVLKGLIDRTQGSTVVEEEKLYSLSRGASIEP